MTFGRNIGGGATAQCVAPDDRARMGTGGAASGDVVVPSGSAAQSIAAPYDGVVIVGLPSGLAVRLAIGIGASAIAGDALYVGPMAWHFPISKGQLVSLFGDGGGGTATVVMAK